MNEHTVFFRPAFSTQAAVYPVGGLDAYDSLQSIWREHGPLDAAAFALDMAERPRYEGRPEIAASIAADWKGVAARAATVAGVQLDPRLGIDAMRGQLRRAWETN
jgi:hypothetical protein